MHLRSNLLLIALLITSLPVYAFKLSPIVQSFKYKGKGATKTFRVVNSGTEDIKLEAEIYTRTIDINNKETRRETGKFIIYPPLLDLKPGASRAIRVTYTGEPVATEIAYRMIVRQIPNKLKKKKTNKSQINFLLEYVASLYVAPKDIKPNLVVESAVKVNKNIELLFENKGTEHILLRHYKLVLEQGKVSQAISFKSEAFKKLGTQNILAGIKRRIILRDQKFKTGKVKAKFIRLKD